MGVRYHAHRSMELSPTSEPAPLAEIPKPTFLGGVLKGFGVSVLLVTPYCIDAGPAVIYQYAFFFPLVFGMPIVALALLVPRKTRAKGLGVLAFVGVMVTDFVIHYGYGSGIFRWFRSFISC